MKFWDSSAVIPLLIEERSSSKMLQILEDDPKMVVWSLSSTECLSALYRRTRSAELSLSQIQPCKERLSQLQQIWTEITEFETVKARAERLLAVHSLRAADSLQLAAALVTFSDRTRNAQFVTLDSRLAEAATREGFSVLGEGS
jgi:uncharacterized protein